eukprot:GHUV01004869.1.p1 GENE.GHUV01004869.1~~GHUV01004869.1.p1  ORF type:complete len:669 (+),score=192.43 GHUV01004869.1:361-2367(+)
MASARSSLDQLTRSRPQFPQGLEVLLVQPTTDQHILQQLQELQYVVTCVKDVPAAVTALTTSQVDVILADLLLVGDLGGEDASQLFSTADQVPVVLIGSQCSPAQVLAAVKRGAADVLEKPLSPLKLRNIWQHTIRAAMNGSSCPASPQPDTAAIDDLMAKHDAAADAAAAAAAALASQSTGQGLQQQLQEQELLAYDESCQVTVDCYRDLGLTALLPSQLDPESLYLELEPPMQPGDAGLDAILQPLNPSGSAAAEKYSTQQLSAAICSSEQHGSGLTGVTAYAGELESSADTSSHRGGGVGSDLQSHGSLRNLAGCSDWQHSATQPAASAAAGLSCNPQQQQQVPAPGCPVHPPMHPVMWGRHCGATSCSSTPKGMVWGMPMYTVVSAPGHAVQPPNKPNKNSSASSSRERYNSCTGSAAASASSSPTHKSRTPPTAVMSAPAGQGPYPPFMMPPPMRWPMMPLQQLMQPYAPSGAALASTQPPAAATAGQMPAYPGMYPGMYPGIFSGMVPPGMGPMGMYAMPYMATMMHGMGFPCMPGMPGLPGWPPMAMGIAMPTCPSGVPVGDTCTAAAAAVTGPAGDQRTVAPSHPAVGPAVAVKQSTPVAGDHSFDNSMEASATAVGATVASYSADGGGGSGLDSASDEFVSGLFVDDIPQRPNVDAAIC